MKQKPYHRNHIIIARFEFRGQNRDINEEYARIESKTHAKVYMTN